MLRFKDLDEIPYYVIPEPRPVTLKQIFKMALRSGKQPKEILERLIDLKYTEDAKLRFN